MENIRDLIIIIGGFLWIFLIVISCLMIFTLYRDFLSLTRIARKLIKNTCETSTEMKKANEILNDIKKQFK